MVDQMIPIQETQPKKLSFREDKLQGSRLKETDYGKQVSLIHSRTYSRKFNYRKFNCRKHNSRNTLKELPISGK